MFVTENPIADVMRRLIEVAEADGIVTDEEAAILSQIEVTLERYNYALKQALEDKVITKEESRKLMKLRNEVARAAREQSKWDGYISEDEEALVEAAVKLLRELPVK